MDQSNQWFNRNYQSFNNCQNYNNDKKKYSFVSWIVILTIFVFVFIFFKNIDNIKEFLWFSNITNNQGLFQIWQSIDITWNLLANWDNILYTHTLNNNFYWKLWLKSSVIDLNQYTWFVFVHWVVDKENNWIFILQVENISWELMSSNISIISWDVQENWKYLSMAWIYFTKSFFDKYNLENNWENNKIKIRNLETNQIINIDYFVCTKSNPEKDCQQLQNNFSQSSDKSQVDWNWNKIYKLESVASWFFANDNFFWYFINDVADQEVEQLLNYIMLPNERYVKEKVLVNIPNICSDWTVSVQEITNKSLSLDSDWLILKINWKVQSWTASCKIFIDPSLPNLGQKISFEIIKIDNSSNNNLNNQSDQNNNLNNQSININFNVKQFPINLEKTMEFQSNKWYKIIFPSRNISYSSVNVEEDLWVKWVNCYSQMNVIAYPNKDQLEKNPSLKIYQCNLKNYVTNLSFANNFFIKTTNSWNLIIQIIDPSWKDFADNIVISD